MAASWIVVVFAAFWEGLQLFTYSIYILNTIKKIEHAWRKRLSMLKRLRSEKRRNSITNKNKQNETSLHESANLRTTEQQMRRAQQKLRRWQVLEETIRYEQQKKRVEEELKKLKEFEQNMHVWEGEHTTEFDLVEDDGSASDTWVEDGHDHVNERSDFCTLIEGEHVEKFLHSITDIEVEVQREHQVDHMEQDFNRRKHFFMENNEHQLPPAPIIPAISKIPAADDKDKTSAQQLPSKTPRLATNHTKAGSSNSKARSTTSSPRRASKNSSKKSARKDNKGSEMKANMNTKSTRKDITREDTIQDKNDELQVQTSNSILSEDEHQQIMPAHIIPQSKNTSAERGSKAPQESESAKRSEDRSSANDSTKDQPNKRRPSVTNNSASSSTPAPSETGAFFKTTSSNSAEMNKRRLSTSSAFGVSSSLNVSASLRALSDLQIKQALSDMLINPSVEMRAQLLVVLVTQEITEFLCPISYAVLFMICRYGNNGKYMGGVNFVIFILEC